MAVAQSNISWCDSTWSPIRGCTIKSDGCRFCYAMAQAGRFSGAGQPYEGLVRKTSQGFRWTGEVRLIEKDLEVPLHWRKPKRIFVASMSDPFHPDVPMAFLDRMFAVMAVANQHTFQLLTKRVESMYNYLVDSQTPFRIQRMIDAVIVDEEMRGQKEEWRSIAPDYEVSSFGQVRSLKGLQGPHILIQSNHSQGYKQVAICCDGLPKTRLVHQLVYEAFSRESHADGEVRHRNGDKSDNRIANICGGQRLTICKMLPGMAVQEYG